MINFACSEIYTKLLFVSLALVTWMMFGIRKLVVEQKLLIQIVKFKINTLFNIELGQFAHPTSAHSELN